MKSKMEYETEIVIKEEVVEDTKPNIKELKGKHAFLNIT